MFSLFNKSNGSSISINEIDNIFDQINLIDVREPYEYASVSVKKSRNVPMSQLLAAPDKYLDKDKQYHIMCQSGGRSSVAVSALLKAGFDAINLKGGIGSYSGKHRK